MERCNCATFYTVESDLLLVLKIHGEVIFGYPEVNHLVA